MDRKRSKGVAILGWSVIVFGTMGLLSSGIFMDFDFLSKAAATALFLYSFLTSILAIVVGIKLLKLEEWARKVIVILAILGVAETIFVFPMTMKSIREKSEKDFSEEGALYRNVIEQYDMLPSDAPMKNNFSREDYIEFVRAAMVNVSIGIGAFMAFLGLLYSVYLYMFFKNSNVKAQFISRESGVGNREENT